MSVNVPSICLARSPTVGSPILSSFRIPASRPAGGSSPNRPSSAASPAWARTPRPRPACPALLTLSQATGRVSTLNATRPRARAGSFSHSSQAMKPLPSSFHARPVSAGSKNTLPVSVHNPPHDDVKVSQSNGLINPQIPVTVPHNPSTTTPLPADQTAFHVSAYQGSSTSAVAPHGRSASAGTSPALNPYMPACPLPSS